MNISYLKLVWCFVTGGGTKVVDYVLGLVRDALNRLSNPTKDKIQALLNFLEKALSVVKAVQVFVPVKWQTAFLLTVKALERAIEALKDLDITGEELSGVVEAYNGAYAAWMSPADDETCVGCEAL